MTPAPRSREEPAQAPSVVVNNVSSSEVTTAKPAKAQALYNFVGQSEKELTITAGQIVIVHDRTADSWWYGTINGTVFGYFPNNYISLLPESEW